LLPVFICFRSALLLLLLNVSFITRIISQLLFLQISVTPTPASSTRLVGYNSGLEKKREFSSFSHVLPCSLLLCVALGSESPTSVALSVPATDSATTTGSFPTQRFPTNQFQWPATI
jgi:hypothetical protein